MAEPPPYIEIPPYATLVNDAAPVVPSEPSTSSPKPAKIGLDPNTPPKTTGSQSLFGNVPTLLLNQALQSMPTPPENSQRVGTLVSVRDPLSIPVMSTNFRRFIGKCGTVFWVQDRVEEVIMWRKGNAYTAAWMAGYAFFCYFPRMVLLIPHIVLLHTLFLTFWTKYPDGASGDGTRKTAGELSPATPPPEGTELWFANMQAIQNLMGIFSDAFDTAGPYLVHLTWATPTTQPLFVATFASFFALIPLLYLVNFRLLFLILGLAPLICTHPYVLSILPWFLQIILPYAKVAARRFVDDDRLREECWDPKTAHVVELGLWENQRWNSTTGDWSRKNLRTGEGRERRRWNLDEYGKTYVSRGELGGVDAVANVKDLNVPILSKWKFVGTEEWSIDYLAGGGHILGDDDGWVYTDDMWANPRTRLAPDQPEGKTRRRRWVRRIWTNEDSETTP